MKHLDKITLIKASGFGSTIGSVARNAAAPLLGAAAFKSMQTPMSDVEQLTYEAAKQNPNKLVSLINEIENIFKTKNHPALAGASAGGDILGMDRTTAKLIGVGGGTALLSYLLNRMLTKPTKPTPPTAQQKDSDNDAGIFVPNKVIQQDYASRRLGNN